MAKKQTSGKNVARKKRTPSKKATGANPSRPQKSIEHPPVSLVAGDDMAAAFSRLLQIQKAVVETGFAKRTGSEFLRLLQQDSHPNDEQLFLQPTDRRWEDSDNRLVIRIREESYGHLLFSKPDEKSVVDNFFLENPLNGKWAIASWCWLQDKSPFPQLLVRVSVQCVRPEMGQAWIEFDEHVRQELLFCAAILALLDSRLQARLVTARFVKQLSVKKEEITELGEVRLEQLKESKEQNALLALWQELADFKPERTGQRFQYLVDRILTELFRESLDRLGTEHPHHGGHGRIDIVFRNKASRGFFHDLASLYLKCVPYIFVECKDHERTSISNAELQQLASRFSSDRGEFGFLVVSRELTDSERGSLCEKCREISRDGRGWILVIDCTDLKAMIYARLVDGSGDWLDTLLFEKLRILTF